MADNRDEHREDKEYRNARVLAALALVTLVLVLGVLDVFVRDYDVEPIYMSLLLGAAVALLLGIRNWRP